MSDEIEVCTGCEIEAWSDVYEDAVAAFLLSSTSKGQSPAPDVPTSPGS
jgi:hypothetical protein